MPRPKKLVLPQEVEMHLLGLTSQHEYTRWKHVMDLEGREGTKALTTEAIEHLVKHAIPLLHDESDRVKRTAALTLNRLGRALKTRAPQPKPKDMAFVFEHAQPSQPNVFRKFFDEWQKRTHGNDVAKWHEYAISLKKEETENFRLGKAGKRELN